MRFGVRLGGPGAHASGGDGVSTENHKVPPLVRHRLEELEADTTQNENRLDGLRDELTQIKYGIWALFGMAAGDMIGLSELISTLL